MTDQEREFQARLFETCLMGDEEAIRLAYLLADVSHVFDDMVDGDNPDMTRNDIYRVLDSLLVKLHYNKFWQTFGMELVPLLSAGIVSWIAANDIEEQASKENDGSLMHVSLITKSAFTPVFLHMAQLLGGIEHARECASLVYKHVYDESIDEYLNEHGVDDDGMFERAG